MRCLLCACFYCVTSHNLYLLFASSPGKNDPFAFCLFRILNFLSDQVTHLFRSNQSASLRHNVTGAVSGSQNLLYSSLNCICLPHPDPENNEASWLQIGSLQSGWQYPCPAISGAEPWLGSYRPNLVSFRLADGQHSDGSGYHGLASSERISPNIFSVRITSNCFGSLTSCIAQLSTSICSSVTSG